MGFSQRTLTTVQIYVDRWLEFEGVRDEKEIKDRKNNILPNEVVRGLVIMFTCVAEKVDSLSFSLSLYNE